MPRLFGITEDGVEYDYTVHFASDAPSRASLPSSQECHERALREDLIRAADSAHWARKDGLEGLLRAVVEWLEEQP